MSIDFADPAFYVDPHAEYARLRDEAPVWWDDNARLWADLGQALAANAAR